MDIHRVLDENPSLIARKAEEAEDLRLIWKNMIERYNNQEAKYVLTLKMNQDIKATEIKYHVGENGELFEARLNLVMLESNYRKKENEIKCLEEELNSAKISARLQIAEMTSLGFNQRTDVIGKEL